MKQIVPDDPNQKQHNEPVDSSTDGTETSTDNSTKLPPPDVIPKSLKSHDKGLRHIEFSESVEQPEEWPAEPPSEEESD